MDDQTSFGYWVRRQRKALDLTQAELARRVSCAEVTIQKIEADERRPSHQIADLLAEHLNIAPGDRLVFLQRARGEQADLPPPASAPVPETRSPAFVSHNLPAQLTSFVGRSAELASASTLLQTNRLLTLTGPGGTGKTRLAIQLAGSVLDQFPDGIRLVELAPLSNPALVAQAVAGALELREEPSRPLLSTLITYLRDKGLLLVLDNCEHLIGASAQIAAELLRACSRLRILATSREPLASAGEAIFQVPALSLPQLVDSARPDEALRSEAIQLFVARARAVQPAFDLTNENMLAVAQICQRLDGIPLAIELAAARLRVLTAEQIAARLNDRFHLLTSGSRTALARHQTLQSLIDWSYDLLGDAERALFRSLAVFVGGWTLETAETVCGGTRSSDALAALPVLDGLAALVDKSLVQADQQGKASRYRMLETIRQYALEKLAESGEASAVARRHAHYYLQMVERKDHDDEASESFSRLEIEHDNLRAALAWSQSAGGAELGLRLVRRLNGYWTMRNHWSEGRAWLTSALAHPEGQARTGLRARVLHELASMHAYLNDYAPARAAFTESLAICEELENTQGRAWVLNRLGWLAREQGDTATARFHLEESLELSRKLNDQYGIITALNTLGEVAMMLEDADWATELLDESMALARAWNDPYSQAWSLNHLGHLAQIQGDYDRALQLHTESLALFRRLSEQHLGTAWAFHGLGESALGQNDLVSAHAWLAEGLAQFRSLGDRAGVSWCLAALGTLAALDEEPDRAARTWGAAEALRTSIGCRLAPAARATYERALASARAQLGEKAFAAAWEAGQALPAKTAIAKALEGSSGS